MLRYDYDVDVNDDGTSHGAMISMVAPGSRVLDVGCATGYIARALRQKDCTVWGIELSAEAAELAAPDLEGLVVGDLDRMSFADEFGDQQFDAILFGDVLEHLMYPARALREAMSALAPEGQIVISIPNVAHASVRLALMAGKWNYTETGLLDETHIRFFTPHTFEALLEEAGLAAVTSHTISVGMFDTEVEISRDEVPRLAVTWLEQQPDALTYQTVLRAVRATDETLAAARERRAREDVAHAEAVEVANHAAADLVMQLESRVADMQAHIDAIQASKSYRLTSGLRWVRSKLPF